MTVAVLPRPIVVPAIVGGDRSAAGHAGVPGMPAPTRVGALIGIEFGPRLFKSMVEESRTHLFTATGYKPDIFAELLPKLG